MQEQDLKTLWATYAQRIDQSLTLNRQNTEAITGLNVQSLLGTMRPAKRFAVAVGILWILFVDTLIIDLFWVASPFFLASAIVQVLITKVAIGVYLYQLALLRRVEVGEPVLATQQRLAQLQVSTLWVARILWLQLPVWTTFHLTETTLRNADPLWLVVQVAVTGAFTLAAGWLFWNIRPDNQHKPWFRWLFGGNEWTPMRKSIELLEQMRTYQQDDSLRSEGVVKL